MKSSSIALNVLKREYQLTKLMPNFINIVTWNANGLRKHILELDVFLKENKVDICLISESHNTKHSYNEIKGYKCYNAIHPQNKAKGGASLFIKENIKHYEFEKIETEQMQVVIITIELKNKKCNVAALYCPPKFNLKSPEYIKLFEILGPCFILGGDFNAKNKYWGSRLSTKKGKELYHAGKHMKCEFHSGRKPTYWPADPQKIPDLIDFFITRGIAKNYVMVENAEGLSSDHSPVALMVSETVNELHQSPTLTNHKTNWEQFRVNVDANISLNVSLKTPYEIECELDNLIEVIQTSAWNSSPSIKNINVPKYPQEVKDLIAAKRKARKTWQTHRSPENKNILNHLCNKLKQMLNNNKNRSMANRLKNLTAKKDTDYSLWKVTKHLQNTSQTIPPIKCDDGSWAKSPLDKANLFAQHLENTFQPLPSLTTNENILISHRNDQKLIPKVSFVELKTLISNNLKNNKAPGYDLITTKVLKELPEKGLRLFLYIINSSIRLKYVPTQWKVAEVIMIPKPGKELHNKSSYRPISLLSTMGKVFEKLLLKRLQPILEERSVIPAHQFGFRTNHSTIEQVHRVTNTIEEAFNNNNICSGLFIDVAQAFDKVWHQGLIYKIHRYLPNEYSAILESYITGRFFRVKHEGEYSKLKKINAGVPQGSVLGPVLYVLFTSDLPSPPDTKIATFADDTAILVTDSNIVEATSKLQSATDEILEWTKKWRMKLNEAKSTHINFTNKKIQTLPIYMNHNIVPYANTAKYLGFTLDAKLRWKDHVKKKTSELNIKYRKMYFLLSPTSEMTMQNKILLYQQILKPIWTYGIQLWGCTKKTNLKQIQTFQNKVLRKITNCPWYVRNDNLHRDLCMPTIAEEIKKQAAKHEDRLRRHCNEDLQYILHNPIVHRRLRRTVPSDLLLMNS